MNIVLIGYRASGKTTVGRLVASRLGWRFVDTDARIQELAGCTIAEIFEREGEAGFRQRESAEVAESLAGDKTVVSMGGGAVLSAGNVRAMRARGRVVWLQAPVDVLWRRMQADETTHSTRPNLTRGGGPEEVRSLLSQREPLYRSAAHVIVDTENRSAEAVTEDVMRLALSDDREK